nr:terminase [Caulobacteraceae bacterium]
AWLEGDWSVVEGAFFDRWSNRNIVKPFTFPDWWARIRAFDWGYAAPFSVGWWAVASDDTRMADGVIVPRGALVRYREWYGSSGKPNEGLRLTAEEVAEGIRDRERGERISHGIADPSIFREDGGPSIAERMGRIIGRQRAADNTRVGRAGAFGGWDQMRARIAGDATGPQLVVFDTCHDFIRTVPVLQHDPLRPEDLDTRAEDHVADETRYACLSRPLPARSPPRPADPPDLSDWDRRWPKPPPEQLSWKVM